MAILLTNDDGIDAPGIAALQRIVATMSSSRPGSRAIGRPQAGPSAISSLTAAPLLPHSGCGHQTTTAAPIALSCYDAAQQIYAVRGTPADCTRVALAHLAPQLNCSIDWVVSGINAGGNLGVDSYLSGTVAAVREAAFQGIPGIAISQYLQGRAPLNWACTERWAAGVIEQLLAQPPQPGCFWNVNLPWPGDRTDFPELVFCPPSQDPLPLTYEATPEGLRYSGRYGDRPASPGTDVAVCFGGAIAITHLAT